MTAFLLDCNSRTFNYDHSGKTKPLKPRRLWEGRWSKITQSSEGQRLYQEIDLAQKIFGFYKNGYTNLSQCELIAGTPNRFSFHKKK